MTAPLPSPYLSPIAGLFNAAVRLLNRLLDSRGLELEAQLAIAIAESQRLKGGGHA